MKFLIPGLGSIGRPYKCWLCSGLWSPLAWIGELVLGLPLEENAKISLRLSKNATRRVQLHYNQHPAAHSLEIVSQEGAGRWISLKTGIQ